jgi:hypothetical protein
VIAVAPDVNGVAKVSLGGGTVDAVCLTSAVLAPNDQVLVLADTDAFWVIGEVGVATAPPAPIITDFPSTAFAAATGFTIDAVTKGRMVEFGGMKLVQLHLQPTRTGAPLVASAAGNITDTSVITTPATALPSERVFFHWTANGTAGSCYVSVSGNFVISDMYPSTTLATGAVFNADITYLMVQ